MSKYSQLITKLFDTNSKFVSEDFYEFVSEITKKYPNDRKKSKSTDQEGNEYVREEVAIFQDANDDKIAIMTIKLPSRTKVERARSQQRNLISAYLRNEWVFQGINSVLVAFYSDDSNDWRLSFVKQEFKLEDNKIINELTPAKRYSFLVESNSRNLTVKQRLGDLISERVLIADIEKAFSVEKVSKEFFEKYVWLYERLSKAFEKDEVFKKIEEENNNGDEHFRENFVKKLLGQIVFLYFLQKKWWLWVKKDEKWWDGDKNFLQNLFRECTWWGNPKKESGWKNFFNDYLEWLFYDNLNRKRENDYSDYFECRIPYLNGGLFEPINGYDWKGVANVLLAWDDNNAIFRDIFETFDEYNFTVYENDPLEQDVAVDPEMLGKVFENLLPENERKWKWAFYTPREIVHYMCKESLKNHLMNKTGISEEKINGLFDRKDSMLNLKRFWEKLSDADRFSQFGEYIDYAEKIVSSLKTIKIVDPAVGSGAFPMGLLKEIVSLRKYLQENILLEENVSEYTIKKETLENCIYGVDLDPWAVEIAKLRFWLSLVIEEESKESIDPLPNLDYKIIQGNSLIEDIVVWENIVKLDIEWNSKKLTKKQSKEIGNASQIGLGFFTDETEQEETLKRLKYLHKKFFQEKDNVNKKKLKEEIDHVEKELIRISGEVEVNRIRTKIESIEWKYLLSGQSPDAKDAKEIERLSLQIQGIKDMEEKYKRDNVRTFFPWKLHFAEVFNENWGFDIVIGNPPYWADIDKYTTLFSRLYPETTKWFKEIYKLFYDRWLNNLCKEWWILSYINPNTVLLQPRYEDLRKFLLKKSILQILNLWDGVFEDVVAPTCIIIVSNSSSSQWLKFFEMSKNWKFLWLDFSLFSIIKQSLFEDNTASLFSLWALQNDATLIPLKKILECKDWGIKYQRVNVWLAEKWKNDLAERLFYEGDKLNNADIRFYIWKDINKDGYSIDFTPERYMRSNYDNILRSNERLYWNKDLMAIPEKIIWRQTSSIFVGTYINVPIYFANTIQAWYLLEDAKQDFNIKYILALLNSNYLRYLYSVNVQEWWRVFPQVKLTKLQDLPIKRIGISEQKPFIGLVDRILEITKEDDYLEKDDSKKQVKVLQKIIDDMVYKLYWLTPEEVKIVEESLKK